VEAEAGAVATSLFHHYFFGNIIICNFAVKLAGFPTCLAEYRTQFEHPSRVCFRDVKAEAKAGSGNGGSGSWKRKRWKRKRGNPPLPLPHRLFHLESNLAKKFCLFPNVD